MWYWLVLALLLLLLIALMPVWPYSRRRWGWYRPGLAGVLLILWGVFGWFAIQPVPDPPPAEPFGGARPAAAPAATE